MQYKLSKEQWLEIGQKAGWLKTAQQEEKGKGDQKRASTPGRCRQKNETTWPGSKHSKIKNIRKTHELVQKRKKKIRIIPL